MAKTRFISSNPNPDRRAGSIRLPKSCPIQLPETGKEWEAPDALRLDRQRGGGILVGLPAHGDKKFVGIPQGADGNLLVVGGIGSGKSSGISMPTLETWDGPICATDIKGELSAHYGALFRRGRVSRPYMPVNPMDPAGPSYDPFWLLADDEGGNLVQDAFGLAAILCPESRDDKDRFWSQSEQAVLAAAVVWSVRNGLGFSEMTLYMLSKSLKELCQELWSSRDSTVCSILGELHAMKEETLACIERGIRNKLMVSAADPRISHFLRGRAETQNCFDWEDLDRCNIFLCLPPDRIDSWGWVINLMYAQLIRHLERRPEQHTPQGAAMPHTLVLMEEFPRFGRLEPIANALATLRSKKAHFCLIVQSLAQLDLMYGKALRAVILDNCPYKLILRAGDAETQAYLSRLIGSGLQVQNSLNIRMDDTGRRVEGLSVGLSEIRDFRLQPHTLATLEDAVFLTPLGACRVEKFPPGQFVRKRDPGEVPPDGRGMPEQSRAWGKEDQMISMEQRAENARRKLAAAQQRQRQEQRKEADRLRRTNHLRTQAVGTMVLDRFPELRGVGPGNTMEQALARLQIVGIFLDLLLQPEYASVLRQIREKAGEIMQARQADSPSGTEDARSGSAEGPVCSLERR